MSRQRMIHPDFFIDEDVAMLSPWARLLLLSLLTQADREGRLADREKRIHLRAFPWDRDVDVAGHLSELVEQGFIARYAVDGGKYISIRNFLKFQKPHPKEAASTIPAPPEPAGELSGRAGKGRNEPEDSAGVGIRNTESESEQTDSPAPPAGKPEQIDLEVEAVLTDWSERTDTRLRAEKSLKATRKRIRERLAEGFTAGQLAMCVTFALKDAFYQSKGYHKDPAVLWLNSERVEKLQTRVPDESGRARGQPATHDNTRVLDEWEREVREGRR
jgi:hypothetical protein